MDTEDTQSSLLLWSLDVGRVKQEQVAINAESRACGFLLIFICFWAAWRQGGLLTSQWQPSGGL